MLQMILYRMLAIVCSFFLLYNHVSAQSAKPGNMYIDTSGIGETGSHIVYIGYPEEMQHDATTSPDSLFTMNEISETTFLAFSRNKSSTIVNDTSTITRTKKSFTIKNPFFKRTFASNIVCECTTSNYLGIIAPLNLYVVQSVDMQNEIAYVDLIDYRTGKSFELPSCADEGPYDIVISPQHRMLLTYSNSDFEAGSCCMHLLSITTNPQRLRFTLNKYIAVYFDRMNIQKLAWINDKSFVIEVTQREEVEYNNDYNYGKKIKRFMKVTLLNHYKEGTSKH